LEHLELIGEKVLAEDNQVEAERLGKADLLDGFREALRRRVPRLVLIGNQKPKPHLRLLYAPIEVAGWTASQNGQRAVTPRSRLAVNSGL